MGLGRTDFRVLVDEQCSFFGLDGIHLWVRKNPTLWFQRLEITHYDVGHGTLSYWWLSRTRFVVEMDLILWLEGTHFEVWGTCGLTRPTLGLNVAHFRD